jgi:hypothetical protein
VKHLRAWFVTWALLWWLWMLLVGEWNHYEWIAASAAATVAATVAEIARSQAGVRARVPRRWLLRGWSALPTVFGDFAILMRALAQSAIRRDVVRGSFHATAVDAGGADAGSVGMRVWRNTLADYSPNAYVVDVDPERGLSLVHALVPRRSSEEPL